jgi:ankyrin repeat protein
MVKFIKFCLTTALFIAKIQSQEVSSSSSYNNFNSLAKDGDLDGVRNVLNTNYDNNNDRRDFINQGDHWNKNTIHYAAEQGHADVINTLVNEFHGDINALDYRGRTALHLAASRGNIDSINKLINLGGSDLVNTLDKEGKNALHYAAETGQYLAIKSLINNGHIDVNSRTHTMKTPLMIASERGHIDFVQMLTRKYNADIELADSPAGMTALMYASKIGHMPIVSILRSTYELLDNHGRSAFHYAVISGQSGLVNYFSKSIFNDNNRNNFMGMEDSNRVTPLHLAAKYGHQNICEMFARDHPDFIFSHDKYGQSPLHLAVRLPEQGFTEILEYHTPLPLGKYTCLDLMIKAINRGDYGEQANELINYKDQLGHTVFSRAVEYGCSTTINRLFKKDVSIDINTQITIGKYHNMNMIHYAIYSNQINSIDTLIRHGVNKKAKMSMGMTPLVLAIKQGSLSGTVKMLHYNNNDNDDRFLEIVDKASQPRTALIWATIQGNVDILKAVIGNGANLEFKADQNDLTALHFAAAKGDAEVVKVLLHAGANYDAEDVNHITPLDTAIYYKKSSVLETLLLQYQKDNGSTPEGIAILNNMFEKALQFTSTHAHNDGYADVQSILETAAAKHYEDILQDFDNFNVDAVDYNSVYYSYYYNTEGGDDFQYLNIADYDDYSGNVVGNKKRKRRSARQH